MTYKQIRAATLKHMERLGIPNAYHIRKHKNNPFPIGVKNLTILLSEKTDKRISDGQQAIMERFFNQLDK